MRILILGGTADASALSERLAALAATEIVLSLAGRTREPRPASVPTRIGGFGGVPGLKNWLVENRTDCVVDATHPFAAIISRNATQACRERGVPLVALRRPPWQRREGDHWSEVATMADAVTALGDTPRRVFLTIGRLELAAFASAPQHHYVVRTIEPIDDALPVPNLIALQARGPFDKLAEIALLREHGIDVVVSKNSGGAATYGKIAAARELGLPVVLVAQPARPSVPSVDTIEDALAWIENHRPAP